MANFGFFIQTGAESKVVITPKISDASNMIRKVDSGAAVGVGAGAAGGGLRGGADNQSNRQPYPTEKGN